MAINFQQIYGIELNEKRGELPYFSCGSPHFDGVNCAFWCVIAQKKVLSLGKDLVGHCRRGNFIMNFGKKHVNLKRSSSSM